MQEELEKIIAPHNLICREYKPGRYFHLIREVPEPGARQKVGYDVVYQRVIGYIGLADNGKYWAKRTKYESREGTFETVEDAFNAVLELGKKVKQC